jgi:hypothetical protein
MKLIGNFSDFSAPHLKGIKILIARLFFDERTQDTSSVDCKNFLIKDALMQQLHIGAYVLGKGARVRWTWKCQ